MVDLRDRYAGVLVGAAVGDALGAPLDGMSAQRALSAAGGGPLRQLLALDGRLGLGTDAVQQALFTAEGLIRAHHRILAGRGGDTVDGVYASLLRWQATQHAPAPPPRADGWLSTQEVLYDRQARDPATSRALRSGLRGSLDTPINTWREATVLVRAGACALAELMPFERASRVATLTHSHVDAALSAGLLAVVLSKLLLGQELDHAVQAGLSRVGSQPAAQELSALVEHALDTADLGEPSVDQLGEVLAFAGPDPAAAPAVLSAALYVVGAVDDPAEALGLAVLAGGGASRLGAVVGQLLGARAGAEALPSELVQGARLAPLAKDVADDLYARFSGVPFELTEDAFERYPG